MVVEHEFVTTLEAPEAMRVAQQLLSSRGFEPSHERAFAVLGAEEWNMLEMRRGKKATRAKNIVELPQTAHLHFDRGRVSLALSIQPSYAWGGGGMAAGGFGIDMTSPAGNPKKMRLHTQLLTAQAMALEQCLAQHQPVEICLGAWDQAEVACRDAARRRRLRNLILIGVFLLLIGACIWAIVQAGIK